MCPETHEHDPTDAPPRVAVVVSLYNGWVTDRLRDGALEALTRLTGATGSSEVFEAPGAFELPVLAMNAIRTGRFDAAVCIGCIIKGETSHDRVIGDAVAGAIQQIACETGVPVGLAVLTVDTPEQAEARAGGALGNKGAEAMEAALSCLRTIRGMSQHPVARAER